MISLTQGEIFFDWPILIITLLIGITLLINNSYKAFLFATLVSLSFGRQTLLFSKIPGLVFINLLDICLLLSIIAYIKELIDKKIKFTFPLPVLGILIVLFIGFGQSIIRYDNAYAMIRGLRWAIGLPILFLLTSSMVKDKERVKSLLWILLIAGIFSSLQHLLWIFETKQIFNTDAANILRNIAFLRGQDAWLITGPFIIAGKIPHPLAQIITGTLFLTTFLAQQTRSYALGAIITIFVYHIWFLNVRYSFRLQRLLPLILIFIISVMAMGTIGLGNLAENYLDRLSTVTHIEDSEDTYSRRNAFEQEISDWMNGNVIFGEGLVYFENLVEGSEFDINLDGNGVAYGHLGYITYLSQLGILGFIVYAIWLPLSVISRSKNVFKFNTSAEVKYLAALTGVNFFGSIFTFIFSASFISPYVIIPGILAGAMWAMPITTKNNENKD